MSLGDYVRFLRAAKGGPTPWEMAEEAGIDSSEYRQIEQRYRRVGTDETLEKLAQYFDVPVEELARRRERPRKLLSANLARAWRKGSRIRLALRTGDQVSGRVEWFDMGATLLRLADGTGEVVVQRHIVEEWEIGSGEVGEPTEAGQTDEEP